MQANNQAGKLLEALKKKWEFLPIDLKPHYKNKITKLQEKYQKIGKSVKRLEVIFNDETNREKLNIQNRKGVCKQSFISNFSLDKRRIRLRPQRKIIEKH